MESKGMKKKNFHSGVFFYIHHPVASLHEGHEEHGAPCPFVKGLKTAHNGLLLSSLNLNFS